MNPARLSIELLCHGVRLVPGASMAELRRTRAGLGSGIDLRLPGPRKTHVINAPVDEPWARSSPWVLRERVGVAAGEPWTHVLEDTRTGAEAPCGLVREPDWSTRRTSSGVAMADVGVLQGSYLGVYVGDVCAFWAGRGESACGFCTTGRNVGTNEVLEKSVADVVETATAAKHESGVTFVHLNAGYAGPDSVERLEPYVCALKEDVGVLVGVQATPARDFRHYDRLRELGVDHLSFCYEFHDPDVLAEHCPGKARALGLELYRSALEHCSSLLGRGACSGEIIAGVEPIETTLEAIDWIASVGAFPTVCVFRPTIGSRMANLPPPDPNDIECVYREVWHACRRHRVPVGLAPNIEVSLVLTPDDCRDLVERPTAGDRLWRAALAVSKKAAGPAFRSRMHARPRVRPD